MKDLLIIGAGTAGTVLANRSQRRLGSGWRVRVIDPEPTHLYQPALLFIPFGGSESGIVRSRHSTLRRGVEWIKSGVTALDPLRKRVSLADGEELSYDLLVLATGSRIRPELTEGMLGPTWRKDVFDFYTLEGARALAARLARFEKGRVLVNVVEMPIKCPVAPLEWAFLADDHFRRRGVRSQVELVYVTPLDGAFTRPIASRTLSGMLEKRGIRQVTEFSTANVDPGGKIVSYEGREEPFDLLVAIPTHGGAELVERSGIGDELAFVPTDPRTLAAKKVPDLFVLGDATDVPASKAGSVAHFEAELLAENLARIDRGREPLPTFDGHANCFVETGAGKAMLIDFNYETEPLPGRYPLPVGGPFSLLDESRVNHWGKVGFRSLYWNALLPGRPIPVPARMSMAGKRRPASPPNPVR